LRATVRSIDNTKSFPLIRKSPVTCTDPLSDDIGLINSLSLLSGAITSGLLDAPGYSPINPNVGPLTIPPSANFGIAAKADKTALDIEAINAGVVNAAAGPVETPVCVAPKIAFAKAPDKAVEITFKTFFNNDWVNLSKPFSASLKPAT